MAGSNSAMRKARSEAGREIPQSLQKSVRERLRLLRLSRGRTLGDIDPEVALVSRGTLSTYEVHDISSMRLYHLYGISRWLDINFMELMAYLFDAEGNDTLIATRQTNSERMNRLLGYLSEEDQKMACDMVDAVVESRGRFAKSAITVTERAAARRDAEGVQGVQATAQVRS